MPAKKGADPDMDQDVDPMPFNPATDVDTGVPAGKKARGFMRSQKGTG